MMGSSRAPVSWKVAAAATATASAGTSQPRPVFMQHHAFCGSLQLSCQSAKPALQSKGMEPMSTGAGGAVGGATLQPISDSGQTVSPGGAPHCTSPCTAAPSIAVGWLSLPSLASGLSSSARGCRAAAGSGGHRPEADAVRLIVLPPNLKSRGLAVELTLGDISEDGESPVGEASPRSRSVSAPPIDRAERVRPIDAKLSLSSNW
mmetsp:Transcript_63478/g.163364  ORF Transcript_63478/g.163364 Transcript_63478/m.163364 type:complete len:205 (-) Transcript_63478:166-780(-)